MCPAPLACNARCVACITSADEVTFEKILQVARNALDVVSRLFDTAAEYENEADLGKALHEVGAGGLAGFCHAQRSSLSFHLPCTDQILLDLRLGFSRPQQALQLGKVSRDDLFVETKLW